MVSASPVPVLALRMPAMSATTSEKNNATRIHRYRVADRGASGGLFTKFFLHGGVDE
jgi:hypothetical protein